MQETTNPSPALLTIDNVSKSFGDKKAVCGISLQVPHGSIFGLLGPNGAGKTTLIRMITNILYPDTGSINLINTEGTKRHLFIGYMPEERGLYKKMKVGEQLMYLAQLKNLSAAEAKEKINFWLKRFDIEDWYNKRVEELSKGMQQKIQFISTVVHEPKLIILDEPFSGLDPINTNLIKDEIFELRERGATVLFSTHRMEQVEAICEHIALVNQGEIILNGPVAELKNRFKKNLYEVEYTGTCPTLSEDAFNLIESMADKNLIRLHLKKERSANDVLQSLIRQGMEVQGFKELLPSLNELFIDQVNDSQATSVKQSV